MRLRAACGIILPMKKKRWIQDAVKKPGALRKALGAKKGKAIPAKKLAAAAKRKGKTGQRARLAQTLRTLRPARKAARPKAQEVY